MIKKKIYSDIVDFYKNPNKALLLTGARQVGRENLCFPKVPVPNFTRCASPTT